MIVKDKIISLRNDPFELSEFLFSLFNEEYDVLEDNFLIEELEDCLFNKEDFLLKKVALYGLLVQLKINNKKYVKRALDLLCNREEEEEVRVEAMNGLIAISDKRDIVVVNELKLIGFNKDDDDYLRYKAIQGLLELNGVPLFRLNLRDNYVPPYEEGFTLEGFMDCVKDDLKKYNLLS